jgi:signal transduction histidine kinase/ActR/RegA family two-component response regulator
MPSLNSRLYQDPLTAQRTEVIFHEQLAANQRHTDHMFAWLMIMQWVAGIAAAVVISPRAWEGSTSHIHLHVWAAIFLGGLISGFPVLLARTQPGKVLTRHAIAVGQMLSCGLFIHLTGGRIESHFQYFVVLAFLAFYRDWRVLVTASAVAAADHFIRGYFWPQSMFGVLFASPWRAAEHTAWIVFEDIVLVLLIRQSLDEMRKMAGHQAKLETINEVIELKVEERTRELRNQIAERERGEEMRKRLEERLYQSQKMETVGKLAGGVAHEFNSILTAIIGQSELMMGDLPEKDPLQTNVQEIHRAADRAATLTRQLLAYGRKQILELVILDLNAVLQDMAGTLQHLVGREVDVRIAPASGLKMVKIDPGQMEQVIVNIAMNAADAMPNGGKLTLETANVTLDEEYATASGIRPGGYVMLAVSDTGAGMSEEVKSRAFEPFYSTKGIGQGTGLGLATCYGIIRQSEGHIAIYSEPGRGTTVKIYLPLVENRISGTLARLDNPGLPHGTETILLAEDDPSLLEMTSTLLKRLGYNVLTAANGIDALNLKRQRDVGHIDLLYTDIIMPHMNGSELAGRIRAIYPDTRILFTSAYAENAIIHQGILEQGVMLLQKPYTPAALANKVRQALDQPLPQKKP